MLVGTDPDERSELTARWRTLERVRRHQKMRREHRADTRNRPEPRLGLGQLATGPDEPPDLIPDAPRLRLEFLDRRFQHLLSEGSSDRLTARRLQQVLLRDEVARELLPSAQ